MLQSDRQRNETARGREFQIRVTVACQCDQHLQPGIELVCRKVRNIGLEPLCGGLEIRLRDLKEQVDVELGELRDDRLQILAELRGA